MYMYRYFHYRPTVFLRILNHVLEPLFGVLLAIIIIVVFLWQVSAYEKKQASSQEVGGSNTNVNKLVNKGQGQSSALQPKGSIARSSPVGVHGDAGVQVAVMPSSDQAMDEGGEEVRGGSLVGASSVQQMLADVVSNESALHGQQQQCMSSDISEDVVDSLVVKQLCKGAVGSGAANTGGSSGVLKRSGVLPIECGVRVKRVVAAQ